MSSINILFYSNHCEGSKLLLSMLQTEKLIRFFHLMCTDNNPKVPPQIKVTPTIMIKGVPTPYVAGDAFSWLAKIKQWKMNMDIQKINVAQQQYLKNIGNNLVPDNNNILGFSELEMNSMSDIFSYFSKNISQECQDACPQSYISINDLGKESIFTPPLEDGSYKIKTEKNIKPNTKNDAVNNLKSIRSKQDEEFKKNIESFRKQYTNR